MWAIFGVGAVWGATLVKGYEMFGIGVVLPLGAAGLLLALLLPIPKAGR